MKVSGTKSEKWTLWEDLQNIEFLANSVRRWKSNSNGQQELANALYASILELRSAIDPEA